MGGLPESEWVWCGYPGHFCASKHCRMHLHTRVGDYRVSTVGDYWPISHPKDSDGPEEIGYGRTYETMVFRVEGEGQHGEGTVADWTNVDFDGYTDAESAERGHFDLCHKYARITTGDEVSA